MASIVQKVAGGVFLLTVGIALTFSVEQDLQLMKYGLAALWAVAALSLVVLVGATVIEHRRRAEQAALRRSSSAGLFDSDSRSGTSDSWRVLEANGRIAEGRRVTRGTSVEPPPPAASPLSPTELLERDPAMKDALFRQVRKGWEEGQKNGRRNELQRLLDEGVELKARVPSQLLGVFNVANPTTAADVDDWEQRAEEVVGYYSPLDLAAFRAPGAASPFGVSAFFSNPLADRLDQKCRRLDEMIRKLPR